MEADLLQPHFHDAENAREYLEAKRWPGGPVCPHCGVIGKAVRLELEEGTKTHARRGLLNCRACRKQFSVTVGTIFEDSHIPLHKWLMAYRLICASKKGMSAHQLHRMLGVSYKSAWFMAHRIRYTMKEEPLSSLLNGIVEVDETYIGGKLRSGSYQDQRLEKRPIDRLSPIKNKAAVVSVLQRKGRVQSRHVERVTAENLRPIVDEMVDKAARMMTDSSTGLASAGTGRKHSQVQHNVGEYVRFADGVCISINSVEGYFATLKRGINGVYHHAGKQRLHRYLSEFDFRYNARMVSDAERARLALKGADGKRLMYGDSCKKKGARAVLKTHRP